jgi:hypothetical protein
MQSLWKPTPSLLAVVAYSAVGSTETSGLCRSSTVALGSPWDVPERESSQTGLWDVHALTLLRICVLPIVVGLREVQVARQLRRSERIGADVLAKGFRAVSIRDRWISRRPAAP